MKLAFRTITSMVALIIVLSSVALASANGTGGVSGPAFYVDGVLYRTVGTPTDFSGTGAPDHSYDTIYAIAGQPNVAEAGPGQQGFDGGRWMVRPVTFNDYEAALVAHDANGSGDFDSNEEVESALMDNGQSGAVLGEVVRSFLCPVIKVPRSQQ